jgi:hypothetical protein
VKNKRLHRTWYKTDVDDNEPEYVGAFSDPFPDPAMRDAQIVAVDWSEPGWVEVTYLVPWG